MLRTRLFQSFAALILLFGVLSAWFGAGVIRQRVVSEAQNRVRLDVMMATDTEGFEVSRKIPKS